MSMHIFHKTHSSKDYGQGETQGNQAQPRLVRFIESSERDR